MYIGRKHRLSIISRLRRKGRYNVRRTRLCSSENEGGKTEGLEEKESEVGTDLYGKTDS
jgi:hypothetical protein